MASEALEQMVEPAFGCGQDNAYQTLDVYTSGLAQMYTGSMEIKPIGGPRSPFGVLDKSDYLSGGIERFRKPEWDARNDFHMNYETLIPGIKAPVVNIHIPMGK